MFCLPLRPAGGTSVIGSLSPSAPQSVTMLRGAEGGEAEPRTPRKNSSSRKSFRLDYRLEVKASLEPVVLSSCLSSGSEVLPSFSSRRKSPNPAGTNMGAGPTPGRLGSSPPTAPCSGSCCLTRITATCRVKRWVHQRPRCDSTCRFCLGSVQP